MDSGYRSPLIECFRRGDVTADLRMMAASGTVAGTAYEQIALLMLLSDDPDPAVAGAANASLAVLPGDALRAFLARPDVPDPMRGFFAARGIQPAGSPAEAAGPLGEPETPRAEAADESDDEPESRVLSTLPIKARMKLAMKGTRTERAQLIRDSNKLVAAAVMSSPKLTDSEVEAFAKMANVSEDVLRIIAGNRAYTKSYTIVSALTRNPKCPTAIAMQLIQRLNERDLKSLAIDRNVPEAVRMAARKFTVKSQR